MSDLSLSKLLAKNNFPDISDSEKQEQNLKSLQLKMLRIQQGVWHKKARAIIVFEGFDAAGKGGTIRRLVEDLDPRGFRVIPTGPPEGDDQQKHYLYRFWKNIPAPGTIAIFDRSWYGRVLVERVNKLVPKERWNAAFDEINQFEKLLADDGVEIIKIFLAISKAEQLTRFEQRLSDPYKNWKLTTADVEARKSWHNYVKAVDEIFEKTDSAFAPWNLIHADHKSYARDRSLRVVTKKMAKFGDWMEGKAAALERRTLKSALKELGLEKHTMNEFAAS